MHTNTSSKHHKYMCMYQAYSQCGHHWINGHCGEAVESPALPNSQGPCTHQSSLSDYWIASLWPPQKPPFYPAAAEVWASWLPWGEGSHTRKLKAQGMHERTHTHPWATGCHTQCLRVHIMNQLTHLGLGTCTQLVWSGTCLVPPNQLIRLNSWNWGIWWPKSIC